MERARGIEPPSLAWEADILPMNYARVITDLNILSRVVRFFKRKFAVRNVFVWAEREKEEKCAQMAYRRIIEEGI